MDGWTENRVFPTAHNLKPQTAKIVSFELFFLQQSPVGHGLLIL